MLRGKCSVITGANRGIGFEILKKIAENSEGGVIFACSRKYTDFFESTIKELSEKYNVIIEPLYFDLVESETIKQAVGKIKKSRKTVDILVNNAGINTPYQRFQMISMEGYRKTMEINTFGHLQFTQYISRIMMKAKSGSIINISSIAGTDGFYASCDYVASKAAIMGITVQEARELGAFGIRVNHIAPGVTSTTMIEGNDNDMLQSLKPSIMLGRFGEPEEIANVVLFLASDLSSYITGQEIRVDGGSSAPRAMW